MSPYDRYFAIEIPCDKCKYSSSQFEKSEILTVIIVINIYNIAAEKLWNIYTYSIITDPL